MLAALLCYKYGKLGKNKIVVWLQLPNDPTYPTLRAKMLTLNFIQHSQQKAQEKISLLQH